MPAILQAPSGQEEQIYATALASLAGIGRATLVCLLERFKPSQVFELLRTGKVRSIDFEESESTCTKRIISRIRGLDVEMIRRQLDGLVLSELEGNLRTAKAGVHFYGGPGYPELFARDPEPPAVIFWKGLEELSRQNPDEPRLLASVLDGLTGRVGIVGTRNCSRYGRDCAVKFGYELSTMGISVVSGLAQGIDYWAHDGAITCGDATPIGVVATGTDVICPSSSKPIYDMLTRKGIVISEYPPLAGLKPWHFPARNRLIAALSQVVVVVESNLSGGAMGLATMSLARDIPTMAVPGSIFSLVSRGTNQLIYQGASPVTDTTDILVGLGLSHFSSRNTGSISESQSFPAGDGGQPSHEHDDQPIVLTEDQLRVLRSIDFEPTPTNAILNRCPDLAVGAIHAVLCSLEGLGLVSPDQGWWTRTEKAREDRLPIESICSDS